MYKRQILEAWTLWLNTNDLTDIIRLTGDINPINNSRSTAVSYTHLRAHETVLDIVCRLLLEKKTNLYEEVDATIISIDKKAQIRY